MTKIADPNERLSTLLRIIDAISQAEGQAEIARQAVGALGTQLKALAGAVWAYHEARLACLYEHNHPGIAEDLIEHAVANGEPLFDQLAGPEPQAPATRAFSILPLAIERTTIGALVIVTASPLAPTERLVTQVLAGYLGARLQAAQARQLAELRQMELAAANQGWNEFVGHAAHEIKNPLASVKGYADLLLRRSGQDPNDQFHKGLTIISQQTGRATELLSDMSDTTRLDSDRLQLSRYTADLGALVQRVAQVYREKSHQHTIEVIAPNQPIEGQFDGQRLSQAVEEMISNAIKFTPNGGPIAIELAKTSGAVPAEAIISVTDHGVGIPEEEQSQIFERFKRASNIRGTFSGLGLGLFKAREIAERHGGRMWVQSKPGAGTTCFLALPLS